MYWPERPEYYLGSFETCLGKYDIYLYKDIWPGILLQDGSEIYEYATMDLSTLKRLLYNGSYSPATDKHGIVPIKWGIAYSLYKKKCEGK